MIKVDATVLKREEAQGYSRALQARTVINVAQPAVEDGKQVTEEPLQQTKSEIAYTVNPDACNRDQAPPICGACIRPASQNPPFLIELGRSIRRALIGL